MIKQTARWHASYFGDWDAHSRYSSEILAGQILAATWWASEALPLLTLPTRCMVCQTLFHFPAYFNSTLSIEVQMESQEVAFGKALWFEGWRFPGTGLERRIVVLEYEILVQEKSSGRTLSRLTKYFYSGTWQPTISDAHSASPSKLKKCAIPQTTQHLEILQ